MSKKTLFLDFDGVLNGDSDFFEARKYGHPTNIIENGEVLNRGCVGMLQQIMEDTDCDVVFSTNWRHTRSEDELYALLVRAGLVMQRERFVGVTKRIGISGSRHGSEIKEYCDEHDVGDIVILDDQDQAISYHFTQYDSSIRNIDDAHWIKTNTASGLVLYQMYAAILILGRTPEAEARDKQIDDDLATLMNVMV